MCRMEAKGAGKGGQPPAATAALDRLEIRGPLIDRLRVAAKQASARLGRRVTPQQYALAVLAHALEQARLGRQVPIPYSRE